MNTVTFSKLKLSLGLAALMMAFSIAPAAVRPVQAAPTEPGVLVFGSVDLDKLLSGYSKKATYDQQVQDLNAKLDAQFKQQVTFDMLTKDQQTQQTQLLSKPTLTSEDQASLTALQAQSTKDSQELTALQQKANPSAQDTARLQQLTQQHQAGQQALQDVADQYRAQVQAEQQRLSAQLSDTVKAAIVTVAKEHGLTMVFTSQVALYSTNDITEDVLRKLNK